MYDVLKYVNENLNRDLPRTEVAERFGYSKRYFREVFKNFTGTTFTEYIQLAAAEIMPPKKLAGIAKICRIISSPAPSTSICKPPGAV